MSLVLMNSLYKNVLAKQNRSSRQLHCVAASNRHMHFLSLFVICWQPQAKLNFHRYSSGTIIISISCQD